MVENIYSKCFEAAMVKTKSYVGAFLLFWSMILQYAFKPITLSSLLDCEQCNFMVDLCQ